MSRVPIALLAALTLTAPALARAHCDTLDGPVVAAARAALSGGNPNLVLAWIQPAGEAEVREAFAKARAARQGGKAAREVADVWFLETVVRVHRAGEGAPYTGLQPAGGSVDPAVAAVDRAVGASDPRAVEALLVAAVRDGLHERWARLATERPPAADVAAGRRWVAAYVPLVHWAEGVRAAAGSDPHRERAAHEGAPGGGTAHAHEVPAAHGGGEH